MRRNARSAWNVGASGLRLAAGILGLVSGCAGGDRPTGGDTPAGGTPTVPEVTTPPDEVVVAATAYWVNTGRFLREGEVVDLAASGSWTMWDGVYEATGPAGTDWDLDGCPAHALIGSVGLRWGDPILCVGDGTALVAPRDGILYLAANDGGREDNAGEVTVSLSGDGVLAPIVNAGQIADFDWDDVEADDVELRGAHVWLQVPRELARAEAASAGASLATFDTWYGHHAALSGATPYGGQPIRFVPDATIRDLGAWMLSGNPIRIDPDAMDDPGEGSHVLRAYDASHSAWGFVHEMGHDFSFINGGAYMIGGGPVEGWANVWSKYTLEQTGYPEASRTECDGVDAYVASGPYAEFEADAWLPLCLLMEIHDQHGGWPTFQAFFASYNALPPASIPAWDAPVEERWGFVRDQLNAAGGGDVTPLLQRYHIPLP